MSPQLSANPPMVVKEVGIKEEDSVDLIGTTAIPLLAAISVAIGAGNVVKSGVNSALGVEVSAATFGAFISMVGGAIVTVSRVDVY